MDKSKFPRIVNAGQPVGKISKAVAEQTGLAEGTLICVGAMDQNCSTLGGGLIEGGSAVVVMGTYGAVFMCVDEPTRDPNGTLIIKNNAGMGNYTFEAASLTAASSYRWYRDVFCSLETALGKDLGEDAYDLINREIERVAPGANGITFLPYLQGAACGPRADPYACGCILGANLATTKPELARAVMEGVTLEMRDNVESVRRLGFEIKDFRMTGGAIKSKLWNQMQADIYMAPVSVLQTSETGCLGAAMYAGVGAGIYKDFKEAAQTAVHISDSYEPNPATFEAYNAAFERFVCAYESLNKGGYFKLHSK
jgi:xylulokinase